MMSDLPADLVEEILCRVPAKSLIRLRSACKGWNSLFKNRGFTEKHSQKAAKQSQILMLKDYTVCSLSVNLNVAAPSIEVKSALSLKDSNSEQFRITTVFHCDGLLLCTTMDERLVVWNPCLRETKWIQLKTDYMGKSVFALGYQNSKSFRSYKILRYRNCYNNYDNDDRFVAFEIYELSSDSWRVLDNVALNCSIQNTGVSLKGNSYWLASDRETNFLLSFDFTTEGSKRLYLPPNLDFCRILLRISVVREEQLSVLIQNFHTSKMEIWITNNIDTTKAALLWRKSFTLDLKIVSYYFCTSCLIDEEKKVAVCCFKGVGEPSRNMVNIIGVDDQYYTKISCVEEWMDWSWPNILNYVPSLVQI